MNKLTLLCIEDEPEVRDALVRDLEPFATALRIECAEDVEDARHVMAECSRDKDLIGLVLCDHVLPGENGVDFLVQLNQDPATKPIKKVLITGQAGLEDTIKAVNQADLDHYVAKPWTSEELHEVVKDQLTAYALAELDPLMPYVEVLDGPRLLEAIARRRSDR